MWLVIIGTARKTRPNVVVWSGPLWRLGWGQMRLGNRHYSVL